VRASAAAIRGDTRLHPRAGLAPDALPPLVLATSATRGSRRRQEVDELLLAAQSWCS